MAPRKVKTSSSPPQAATEDEDGLPLERSVGYQVRMTHRALQRYLQIKIKPHGVTLGTWYSSRAVARGRAYATRAVAQIGTREPTTMTAILAMEANGLVKRVRNDADRRKQNVFLTPRGRRLKSKLLPLASEVVNTATAGFASGSSRYFSGCLQPFNAIWSPSSPMRRGSPIRYLLGSPTEPLPLKPILNARSVSTNRFFVGSHRHRQRHAAMMTAAIPAAGRPFHSISGPVASAAATRHGARETVVDADRATTFAVSVRLAMSAVDCHIGSRPSDAHKKRPERDHQERSGEGDKPSADKRDCYTGDDHLAVADAVG